MKVVSRYSYQDSYGNWRTIEADLDEEDLAMPWEQLRTKFNNAFKRAEVLLIRKMVEEGHLTVERAKEELAKLPGDIHG